MKVSRVHWVEPNARLSYAHQEEFRKWRRRILGFRLHVRGLVIVGCRAYVDRTGTQYRVTKLIFPRRMGRKGTFGKPVVTMGKEMAERVRTLLTDVLEEYWYGWYEMNEQWTESEEGRDRTPMKVKIVKASATRNDSVTFRFNCGGVLWREWVYYPENRSVVPPSYWKYDQGWNRIVRVGGRQALIVRRAIQRYVMKHSLGW